MNLIDYWPVGLCALVALVAQAIGMRVVQQRQLTALRNEHKQVLTAMRGEIEQMTARLRQLQREHAASEPATVRIDTAARRPVTSANTAREALERELDADSGEHQESKGDGFADTQIMAPEEPSGGLLLQ
jgi:hypothetical protein